MRGFDEGKRGEWTFRYTCAQLAAGAEEQKEHRLSRLKAWTEARDKLMAEIRESGIEISESAIGDAKSYANTHVMGPQVLVNTDLQRKLTEAHQKIIEHRNAVAEYDGWIQVLRANEGQYQEITWEDWLYFFGKR